VREKTITILIDENGNSAIDLEGFAGRGCTKAFDDFRGDDRVQRELKKPSYFSHDEQDQKQQIKR
jgi:hypothetical protein